MSSISAERDDGLDRQTRGASSQGVSGVVEGSPRHKSTDERQFLLPELHGAPERGVSGLGWLKTRFDVFIKNNVGLLLVVGAEMFFAIMALSVKILSTIDPPVSVHELIIVRMGFSYVSSIIYMVATGVPDPFLGPRGVRRLLVVRGLGGFVGMYGIYYSLQYLALSDATVLTFLAPMGTTVAGAVFLGEHLTVRQFLAGLFSLLGVIFIARPPFLFGDYDSQIPDGDSDTRITPGERLLAVGFALLGVLGGVVTYTSLRAIGKRASPMHFMIAFSSSSVLYSSTAMLVSRTEFIIPRNLPWLATLFSIVVFGFIGQILLVLGLQRETAGRGTMAVYMQIVFATILQRVFLHVYPPLLSVVGTVIIVASALYTALSKLRQNDEPSDTITSQVDEERGLLDSRDDDEHD